MYCNVYVQCTVHVGLLYSMQVQVCVFVVQRVHVCKCVIVYAVHVCTACVNV